MNPLAKLNKNLREIEVAYGMCKTEESKGKAVCAIQKSVLGMGIGIDSLGLVTVGGPSVSLAVEGAESVGVVSSASFANVGDSGAITGTVVKEAPDAQITLTRAVVGQESGSVGVGEVVLTPVSDHEHEVGGEVSVEQKVVDVNEPPVDGWPVRGKIKVRGLFPNRRRLYGELEDGRVVAVERKPGIQSGSVVVGKIVLGGRPPLYRVVG